MPGSTIRSVHSNEVLCAGRSGKGDGAGQLTVIVPSRTCVPGVRGDKGERVAGPRVNSKQSPKGASFCRNGHSSVFRSQPGPPERAATRVPCMGRFRSFFRRSEGGPLEGNPLTIQFVRVRQVVVFRNVADGKPYEARRAVKAVHGDSISGSWRSRERQPAGRRAVSNDPAVIVVGNERQRGHGISGINCQERVPRRSRRCHALRSRNLHATGLRRGPGIPNGFSACIAGMIRFASLLRGSNVAPVNHRCGSADRLRICKQIVAGRRLT